MLKGQIKEVEAIINDIVSRDESRINAASAHILSSGGKRIRPYFVLLSGSFGQNRHVELIKTASALEIVHMASLVHDDYIDNSSKRRGKDAIHEVWDGQTSVQTGHYLLASALQLISDIDNPDFHQYFSDIILEVCYGEFDQLYDRYDSAVSLTEYLRRINRKTAVLIEASCKLGAMSTDTDAQTVFHLAKFGHFMGMSYQIIDDILDYTSSEEVLGKPVGSDIRNGHVTLPLMFAAEDAAVKKELNRLSADQTDEYFNQLIDYVKKKGIEPASTVSRKYAEKAKFHLLQLPESDDRQQMEELLAKMTKRIF
ncbi:hexaprenyl-diphosphate synthase large subunit [Macrococcus brunensis]|uniref:hexaprenyl-diphosphate synthase large subunit n=1 Tax=Macrococcus brunensis TaxID=198483 RepID=UPI001EF02638|nr:hexaprenyl-diphosphate synthase large subunit [Macrococcus brunensis]ULG71026.1 polyprenyl synthetase family protein [Macrococcus brunensis]ULG73363.1 polyprenyl synthetase family protein [Macrococcus brunensis]